MVSTLERTTQRFLRAWKTLFLTDLAYKLVSLVILGPVVGLLIQTLIFTSGNAVVADLDLAFLLFRPLGIVGIIVVGALYCGIIALEQASLLTALGAQATGAPIGPIGALRWAAAHTWPILLVAVRLVAIMLAAVSPFLLAAGMVFQWLLSEFDINYYLQEQPTEFQLAVVLGVLLGAAILATLLYLASRWFFALQLVIFEGIPAGQALKTSSHRTQGIRRLIIAWLGGWLLIVFVASLIITTLVGLSTSLLLPESSDSLRTITVTLGIALLVWAILNLLLSLFTSSSFATLSFGLYVEVGREASAESADTEQVWDAEDYLDAVKSKHGILIASLATVSVATVIGAFAVRTQPTKNDVKIMAHRGASDSAPENTMAAFDKAIEIQADWIELDVQESQDGEVVVFHDRVFMKLSGDPRQVWNSSLQELQEIDIGSWFGDEYRHERVPKLSDVLERCKGQISVNIELKYYGHDQQLEERVVKIVESLGMESDIVIMSLKMDAVKKIKTMRPNWKVGLVMSVAAGDIGKLDVDFLAVNAQFANQRLLQSAHASGKEVYVWTVDDAPTMSTMIGRGVDGLLTNRPALAKSVIEQRALMSTPERLLLEFADILGVESKIGEQ